MNVLRIIFAAILFTLFLSRQASAELGHTFAVDDLQYEYTQTGVPHIHLRISNRGVEIETPEIVVILSKAVPSRLNDYEYETIGKAKANLTPTLLPNQQQLISIIPNQLLKAGDYEALVTIKFSDTVEKNRFEFSVEEDDIHVAKLQMAANHIEFPIHKKPSPLWMWLFIMLITFYIVLMDIKYSR